jgi:membrane associated rhomboid family serine protease
MQHSGEHGRRPRRWPVATVSVLAVTAVLTVLQYPFPQVRLALWRDPDAIAAGQWWRLVTALFVQYDAVWQIVVVFACIAAVGVLAERVFGHGWWLLLYLGCGVVGQVFGVLWEPPDAGASVAGAGLLGAVCAWGQANASPGLRVPLAVGATLALLVAVVGGVLAFRSPAADSALHDRRALRRYGLVVGAEFALAGAGAAALAATGHGDLVPVWVCAVVAAHMLPLASLLGDRLLVALGGLLAAVALAALVAALATTVPASTVTGLGAGVLLTLFAAVALADAAPSRHRLG